MQFEFQDSGIFRFPADLQAQLDRLDDNHPLLLEIGNYLQKSHHRRVSLQRTVDGGAFRPRKVKIWKGKKKPNKMLQGMHRIQIALANDQVEIGYSGSRAALARWHNEGQVGSDGKSRPRRNWFGIGINDRKAIDRIIEKHLSSK